MASGGFDQCNFDLSANIRAACKTVSGARHGGEPSSVPLNTRAPDLRYRTANNQFPFLTLSLPTTPLFRRGAGQVAFLSL